MSKDSIAGLIALLQRILDAEAVLGAVLHGGAYAEENRIQGMRVLDETAQYAKEHGDPQTAEDLMVLHLLFPDDHELAQARLREVRISTRLRLDAATNAAGLPRVPPASIGKRVPERRTSPKVGRNQPCPCGSGKKHKRCCGGPRIVH